MPVFNYCNTKFVLIVCLLLNSVSLIMFTLTNQYYVLVLSRMSVGFFQVNYNSLTFSRSFSAYISQFGLIFLRMRKEKPIGLHFYY
jgi:hypothetical protein